MAPAVRRPVSMALLVGLIPVLTAAGLFVAFAPVTCCPECDPSRFKPAEGPATIFFPDGVTEKLYAIETPPPVCDLCRDRHRITLARKWSGSRGWEGKQVAARASRGFQKTDSTAMLDLTGIRLGSPITRKIVIEARETL